MMIRRVAKEKKRRGISESSCTSQVNTPLPLEVPQTSSPSPITFGGSLTPVVLQAFAVFAPQIQETNPQYPTGGPIDTPIPQHFESYNPSPAQSPPPDPPIGSPDPNPDNQPEDSDDDMAGDSKGPQLAPPTPFTGDRKKMAKFISETKLFITAKPKDFPTEFSKIALILSYMKEGPTGSWAMNWVNKYDPDTEAILNVKDFYKTLEKTLQKSTRDDLLTHKSRTSNKEDSQSTLSPMPSTS
ncbi:hypothetical protein JAAARDRAFT_197144 [Jaapia argillacea MUCL 33604]|uniref:DUF4939 domain-containing protein n=1 Tax=Jaapia argillacea MUCL 33604 TaxID=933084 RepID=A0A067PTL6_9AGAM|nr:hypothetical protein JAAARDRAFT_197144 [Jaapia argillacea MUCL 33604]